jgi:hypothetical protein
LAASVALLPDLHRGPTTSLAVAMVGADAGVQQRLRTVAVAVSRAEVSQ